MPPHRGPLRRRAHDPRRRRGRGAGALPGLRSVASPVDLAALYDWECERVLHRTDQDLVFYRSLLARTGGPALELACGTGRVAAAVGAVGLDLDPAMARRAAARGVPVVVGDMRAFAFGRRFPLVLIPWNSLQLLDAAGRAACLACVTEHLAPDGLLGLELIDVEPLESPMAPVHADGTVSLEGALAWTGQALAYRRRYTVGATAVESVVELHPMADDELGAAGFEIVEREDDGPRRRLALRYAGAPR